MRASQKKELGGLHPNNHGREGPEQGEGEASWAGGPEPEPGWGTQGQPQLQA